MTAIATVVFLFSKFVEGTWVVVVAVPAFVYLFVRIHAYYQRAGRDLGLGTLPGKPQPQPSLVIVPVTAVSRLTKHAISEALSLSRDVIAVTVVLDSDQHAAPSGDLQDEWARWDPGVPLRVLHTDYASVVGPIVSFIDQLREHHDEQIVVLIPVVVPERVRYRVLHNQIDLVLSSALRSRTYVVVARVQLPLETLAQETDGVGPAPSDPSTR